MIRDIFLFKDISPVFLSYSNHMNFVKMQILQDLSIWNILYSILSLFGDNRSLRFYASTSVGAFFNLQIFRMSLEGIEVSFCELKYAKK